MTDYLFPPPPLRAIPVAGMEVLFPVHRIYCVGQNYAAHAREMGSDPRREPPFFFAKPVDAILLDNADIPYPQRTSAFHHEIELVVAIGSPGRDITASQSRAYVFGYAVGNDLTRRDLQNEARARGQPWDVSKGFDASAVVSAIQPAAKLGHPTQGRIWLEVNGERRQESDIRDMIWKPEDIVAELSTLYCLHPGDLIFTGTPAGIGPVVPGDVMTGGVEGVGTITNRVITTLQPP